jgi:hypothetical protein
MFDDTPPASLFYTTVEFEDGEIETPHYLIFDSLPEAILSVREHYQETGKPVSRFVMKELAFVKEQTLHEDTHILVHLNDRGIEDEFRDPVIQQAMVDQAEEGDALMAILPYEQENDHLLCRAFYMGPFFQAADENEFVLQLERAPFATSQPVDYVWLYRPTGLRQEVEG